MVSRKDSPALQSMQSMADSITSRFHSQPGQLGEDERAVSVAAGSILAVLPHVNGAGLQIAFLVVGSGLCGSIYVVCPPMLGEFTPVSQRGAVIAIYGAIYTLAGILSPSVMGSVIQRAEVPLDGYMTGFTINAVIMVVSGILGLLLLWPNTERARLLAQAAQPKFA
jgi:MFS family permease